MEEAVVVKVGVRVQGLGEVFVAPLLGGTTPGEKQRGGSKRGKKREDWKEGGLGQEGMSTYRCGLHSCIMYCITRSRRRPASLGISADNTSSTSSGVWGSQFVLMTMWA